MLRDISGLDNFDVGVTDIPLAADKPPTSLATADYHICGAFVDTLPVHSRVRLPCESARGRYVFVRTNGNGGLAKVMICEMEVYVQRKYNFLLRLLDVWGIGVVSMIERSV